MDDDVQDDRGADGWGFAVAVALASVLAVDPGGWFPFSIAKWVAVSVCALVAVANVAWKGAPSIGRRLTVAWVILLAAVVTSAVTGLEGSIAWLGTPVRHLGALTWIVFALLFVVGVDVSKRRAFSRGMTVVGGAVGFYTVWEIVLGAPVDYVSDSSRAGGPYGSAAYLGAACCLFLPIAVSVAWSATTDRRWRVGGAIAAALLVAAVIGSGTRGALVALAAVGLIVVFTRAKSHRQRRVAVIAVGAAAGVVVFVAVTTERFARAASIGSRLDEWRLGVTALRDRPLRGFGPEGYRLVVDRFLPPEYVRSYGDRVLPDRAHNAVLDVALSSGVVAAVAYAVLLTFVAIAGIRLVRAGSVQQVGLGAASVAFVLQQQFLFPIAEIDAVFWIVAGTTVASARAERPVQCTDIGRVSTVLGRSMGGVLIAAAIVVAVVGVRSLAADRLARSATESGDAEQAISDARRAVGLDPDDVRLPVILARSHERLRTLNGVDAAIDALGAAQSISPLDPTVRREAARLASLRASITGTPDDRRRAIAIWQELTADAPNCATCQRSLGLTLLEAGDRQRATVALKRAAELGDDVATGVLADLTGPSS